MLSRQEIPMLNVVRYQSGGDGWPLLVAHGLFGSARNWGAIAKRLSVDCPVLCVDMRNHGESNWHTTHSYADLAADLAEVIANEDRPFDVLGHSMGGKAAMMLALTRPELVNRLIVADIAPVTYLHSQNALIDAMRNLDLTALTSRGEADQRLSAEISDASVRAFLLQSLDLRADPVRWRLNLDVLRSEMALITGWPDISATFTGETLMLSGALSDYVKSEYRPAIKAHFPDAKFAKIPGAGHWLHAEAPRPFEATIRSFLP
jgi:esterase